MTYIEVTS